MCVIITALASHTQVLKERESTVKIHPWLIKCITFALVTFIWRFHWITVIPRLVLIASLMHWAKL